MYVLVMSLGAVIFLGVRSIGERNSVLLSDHSVDTSQESLVDRTRTSINAPSPGESDDPHVLGHILATLTAVIVLGYTLGRALRWFGQPAVIGEVLAGIVLGPSLLGYWPDAFHLLLPEPSVDPHAHVTVALKTIAELGVLLYMFVVGLDLHAAQLRHQAHTAVAISHSSIAFPFVLGSLLALWLHPIYAPVGVSFTSFALFVGVAMAITAFPVLARILTDRGMERTGLGTVALAAAAADDVTAWCLLALVVGIVQSRVDTALWVVVGSIGFITAMLLVGRPLARHWCAYLETRPGSITTIGLVSGLAAVLTAGWATDSIGIHSIFGGFLLGVIVPHESRLASELKERLRAVTAVLLLPAFFAYTGMRTQIGLVSGWENIAYCIVIILVATAGKFFGTLLAARVTGTNWRESAALGVLMNTRGLMELIVLNIGLDLGVISETFFAIMVIMALATTLATAPLLHFLIREPVTP